MGLLSPYSRSEKSEDGKDATTDTAAQSAAGTGKPNKKNAPTPTRRQAEEERRQRLHPNLTAKERRQRARQIDRARREREQQKLFQAPERVLVQNMVDARVHVSEFTWIIMAISLVLLIFAPRFPMAALIANYVVWLLVAIIVVEVAWEWSRFKKLLAQRHPGTSPRGLFFVMLSRMITLRRFRYPAPALKAGDSF